MTKLEYRAVRDAATHPGGWALFNRKTTERLAGKGWFMEAVHPAYGRSFKITQAGLAAYEEGKRQHG
jgi:hypothetical protein